MAQQGEVVVGGVRARAAVSARLAKFDESVLEQLALVFTPPTRTFGEVAAAWLSRVRRVRILDEQRNVEQLRPLWPMTEATLTAGVIDEWFQQLASSGFSAISINKYRSAGTLAVRDAQSRHEWGGTNPFALTKRLKEPKKKRELPHLWQLRAAVGQLAPEYRHMVQMTLAFALRTGELFALRVEDVDFSAGVLRIHRSHARDETKTGVVREIPLLAVVWDTLREVTRGKTPGELVFPSRDGKLRRADSKMAEKLREAFTAAGVLEQRLKGLRWYDLRHLSATLHRMAGADKLAVKRLMGHRGDDITEDVYLHPDVSWLKRELSRLHFDL